MIYCVDQSEGNDETGAGGTTPALAASNPYLTWGGLPTFNAGDAVLTKRGTSGVVYAYKLKDGMTLEAYYNSDGTDDIFQPRPVLDGNDAAFILIMSLLNDITIRNLKFVNGKAAILPDAMVSINRCNRIKVLDCEFEGDGKTFITGITVFSGANFDEGNYRSSDILIRGNTFTNLEALSPSILLNIKAQSAFSGDEYFGQPDNIVIDSNTARNCGWLLRTYFPYDATIDDGLMPTNMRVTNNTATDCKRGITVSWAQEGDNCCSNNALIRTGGPTTGALNVIQTATCLGGKISGNHIDGCETNDGGDGAGIILDWGYPNASEDRYSIGVLVEENTVLNCRHSAEAPAVAIWRAQDCVIRDNRLSDGISGVSLSNPECTGNVIKKNTVINMSKRSYATRISGAECTITHNIFDTAPKGFEIVSGSAPIENNNYVVNVGSNDIFLDDTDITDDPNHSRNL